MTIHFEQAIPILRIFDEEKAEEFYLGWLGFTADWRHRFEPGLPLYMQVSRPGIRLHLSGHHGDATPGSAVFIRMTGIDAFHAELMGKPYRHARPSVELAPWRAKEVAVTDPFGNRLRFNEYLDDGTSLESRAETA